MPDALPFLAVWQLHFESSLRVLHQKRESSVIAVRATSRDGIVHCTQIDMCFIFIVFDVQRTKLALIEAHFLMAILRGARVVGGFFIVDHQRWIVEQSEDDAFA